MLSLGPQYPGYNLMAEHALVRLHICVNEEEDWGSHSALSLPFLDAQASLLESHGSSPRVLLITNPSNPMGATISQEAMRTAAVWCRRRYMHLIVNEMYLTSQFSALPSKSVLEIFSDEELAEGYIHTLYAISKDLSLPGLRTSFFISSNEALCRAMQYQQILIFQVN